MIRRSSPWLFGVPFVFAALTAAGAARAELRCDRVTPADVEKQCSAKTHVVAGAGEEFGEKHCSRLLSADDLPGARKGGVSIHVLRSTTPVAADPKWTDVKPVPGFDAAFSYQDEPTPGDKVTTVVGSRGGLTAYVTLVGAPLCSTEQAVALLNVALPAPTADDRGTAFEASSARPEVRDGGKLLVTAYAIIWLLVTAYLAYLWNAQRGLSDRIAGLERAIDRAEAREAGAKKPAAKPKGKAEPTDDGGEDRDEGEDT
jgi:CcmD family protein